MVGEEFQHPMCMGGGVLRVGIIVGVTLRMSCMCNDAIGREYYHHKGNNVLILKKKKNKQKYIKEIINVLQKSTGY